MTPTILALLHKALSQVGPFLTEPLALAVMALLLSAFALFFTYRGAKNRRLAHAAASRFRDGESQKLGGLSKGIDTLEKNLRQRKRAAVIQQAEPVHTPYQPQAPALSALETRRAEVLNFLDDLLVSLERWAQLAGFSLDDETGVRSQISRLRRDAQPPAGEDALNRAVNVEMGTILTEAVKVLLLKCDRDADPKRTNTPLQEHIQQLARPGNSWSIGLIDPRDGDRLDLRHHESFGPVSSRGGKERGLVAATRTRGLKWKDHVIFKAEVLEYD